MLHFSQFHCPLASSWQEFCHDLTSLQATATTQICNQCTGKEVFGVVLYTSLQPRATFHPVRVLSLASNYCGSGLTPE